jgi:hypothetical protein
MTIVGTTSAKTINTVQHDHLVPDQMQRVSSGMLSPVLGYVEGRSDEAPRTPDLSARLESTAELGHGTRPSASVDDLLEKVERCNIRREMGMRAL